jgi:hypothetical protein
MNYIREAIDYLRNYQDLKIAAENLEDKINELNGSLEGYKEINNSGMPEVEEAQHRTMLYAILFSKEINQ